jgi:hypothetical protein
MILIDEIGLNLGNRDHLLRDYEARHGFQAPALRKKRPRRGASLHGGSVRRAQPALQLTSFLSPLLPQPRIDRVHSHLQQPCLQLSSQVLVIRRIDQVDQLMGIFSVVVEHAVAPP